MNRVGTPIAAAAMRGVVCSGWEVRKVKCWMYCPVPSLFFIPPLLLLMTWQYSTCTKTEVQKNGKCIYTYTSIIMSKVKRVYVHASASARE